MPASRSAVLVEADGRPDAVAIAAEFRSPPVTEVSLAISFQPLRLGVISLGDIWHAKFEAAFPKVQEETPVRLGQERFEGSAAQVPAFSLELATTPTLPRLWFLNESGTELLQLQADWIARNWRETEEAKQPYDLYPAIRKAFESDLAKLVEFVDDRNLGPVQPVQAEITYINHIEEGDLSRVLLAVQGTPRLPAPEATSYGAQYVLTRDAQSVGRLHLSATKAIHRASGQPISVVTLTARGRPLGDGLDGALAFLDLGAEKALEAFVHSTTPEMHERWRQG
jgi:uncharacterized protein (TIGR04255 family)